ncbi:hypothetical protein [Noviherbaspirillum sp.]|uniref:hypothetical protein n=1 Tax=Noviherbaspirillum sp. TaxID=1926288 RepID=UPI002D588D7D|nr:hypothetical protein [Noviherbaspirillum sp.]HZW22716.1 hypothetical protein [Noviherbaspirillum sp.]
MRNPFTRNHLLSLIAAPLIWAAHFLACYLFVSIACALAVPGARTGIAAATTLALALIAVSAWSNYRKWSAVRRSNAPDAPTHAFFALNAMMLAAMSALALSWVAFPALMLPVCAA